MLTLILLKYAAILLLTLVLGACISYVGYIYYLRFRCSHIPGPKMGSFLLGSADIFKPIRTGEITFAEVALKLHDEFGPVVKICAYHIVLVIVADPPTVKTLLMNKEHLKPATNYKIFNSLFGQRLMGTGLVSEVNNERWERHRRIFNPAFNRKYLMELAGSFNESADKLVQLWEKQADGKTEVKLMDGFQRVTLDVIGRVAFGMEGDMVMQESAFLKAIENVFTGMIKLAQNLLLPYDPRKQQRDFKAKCVESIRFLRQTGKDVIHKRIEAQKKGEELPKNILSCIIQAAIAEDGLNMEEMVDEFVTFFVAGQETTSNVLGFTLLELGRNPDILQKLVSEVDSVIGKKKVISYEDVMKLEYMSVVLKETLRLYPPVSGTSRCPDHDLEVAGYKILAGSNVMMFTFAMGRMERFFKDPLRYNPERFCEDEDKPMYAYFPFSMGPRSCIGQNFAQIEAKIIISKLLQNFTFELVPTQSFQLLDQLTLKPKGGCMNMIRIREDRFKQEE